MRFVGGWFFIAFIYRLDDGGYIEDVEVGFEGFAGGSRVSKSDA